MRRFLGLLGLLSVLLPGLARAQFFYTNPPPIQPVRPQIGVSNPPSAILSGAGATGGSTTYEYAVVGYGHDPSGLQVPTLLGGTSTTTAGHLPLSAGVSIVLTTQADLGSVQYDFLKLVNGSWQSICIGVAPPTNPGDGSGATCTDSGQTPAAYVVPGANATADLVAHDAYLLFLRPGSQGGGGGSNIPLPQSLPPNQFAVGFNASGSLTSAQPNAGQIASGTFPGAYTFTSPPTMSGANLASATIPEAALVNSTVTQGTYSCANISVSPQGLITTAASGTCGTGGTTIPLPQSLAANFFATGLNSSGNLTSAQPSCSNLSNGAASCSTDTTNAGNISSGILPAARLPSPTSTTLGGVLTGGPISGQVVTAINANGSISFGAVAAANVTGLGTAAVQNTGTSGATIPFLNGNNTWSGSNNFGAAAFSTAPTMSGASIATATIPQNALVTTAVTAGNYVCPTITISPQGTITSAVAGSCSGGGSAIPLPQSLPANQFATGLNSSGNLTGAQPACATLSNAAASCSTDATNAANISSGTLAAGRLPLPTASTIGGVESGGPVSNEYVTGINTSGALTFAQPDASQITGLGTAAILNTGVSGNTIPLNNGGNQFSGAVVFTLAPTMSGANITAATIPTAALASKTGNGGIVPQTTSAAKTSNDYASWDAGGNLVDSGFAIGSGGGGGGTQPTCDGGPVTIGSNGTALVSNTCITANAVVSCFNVSGTDNPVSCPTPTSASQLTIRGTAGDQAAWQVVNITAGGSCAGGPVTVGSGGAVVISNGCILANSPFSCFNVSGDNNPVSCPIPSTAGVLTIYGTSGDQVAWEVLGALPGVVPYAAGLQFGGNQFNNNATPPVNGQCLGLVSGTIGGVSCGSAGGTPGGSAGAIQYNNAGSFGGASITGLVLGNGASAPSAYAGISCSANQWLTGLTAAGAANSCTQPAFSNLSGSATSAQLPAGWNPTTAANGGTGSTAAPLANQLLVGQTGSVYAPETMSGDCTLAATGAITCTKTNGVVFSALATAATPLATSLGGTGSTSPGLTNGTGITITGTFPNQVVALTNPVATNLGGTGTGSALTGLVRGGNPFTAAELSGDVTTSGSNVASVVGLHFTGGALTLGAVPTSGQCLAVSGTAITGTACGGGGGSGTVNNAAQYSVPYYASAGSTNTLAGVALSGLQLDSTTGSPAAYAGTTCTSQALTALSAAGAGTCTTITSAFVNNSIALTGTDINTSNQVANLSHVTNGSLASGGLAAPTGGTTTCTNCNLTINPEGQITASANGSSGSGSLPGASAIGNYLTATATGSSGYIATAPPVFVDPSSWGASFSDTAFTINSVSGDVVTASATTDFAVNEGAFIANGGTGPSVSGTPAAPVVELGTCAAASGNGYFLTNYTANNFADDIGSFLAFNMEPLQYTSGTAGQGQYSLSVNSGTHVGTYTYFNTGEPGLVCYALTTGAYPAGTHTIQVKVAALDGAGGMTAASSASTIITAGFQLPTQTQPILIYEPTAVSGAAGYAFWESINGGAYIPVRVVWTNQPTEDLGTATTWAGRGFVEWGTPAFKAEDIPATPPTTALPDNLLTTVTAVSGTTVTLAAAPATTSAFLRHDDTAAWNAALAACPKSPYTATSCRIGLKAGATRINQLLLPSGLSGIGIVGQGPRASYMEFFGNGQAAYCIGAGGLTGGQMMVNSSDVYLDHLGIISTNAAADCSLNARGPWVGLHIEDVEFDGVPNSFMHRAINFGVGGGKIAGVFKNYWQDFDLSGDINGFILGGGYTAVYQVWPGMWLKPMVGYSNADYNVTIDTATFENPWSAVRPDDATGSNGGGYLQGFALRNAYMSDIDTTNVCATTTMNIVNCTDPSAATVTSQGTLATLTGNSMTVDADLWLGQAGQGCVWFQPFIDGTGTVTNLDCAAGRFGIWAEIPVTAKADSFNGLQNNGVGIAAQDMGSTVEDNQITGTGTTGITGLRLGYTSNYTALGCYTKAVKQALFTTRYGTGSYWMGGLNTVHDLCSGMPEQLTTDAGITFNGVAIAGPGTSAHNFDFMGTIASTAVIYEPCDYTLNFPAGLGPTPQTRGVCGTAPGSGTDTYDIQVCTSSSVCTTDATVAFGTTCTQFADNTGVTLTAASSFTCPTGDTLKIFPTAAPGGKDEVINLAFTR